MSTTPGHATAEMAAFTVDGRIQSDRIFPHFIVSHLPPGVVGLVVAAVFAAAMSTLSSSLNSSSATAMADFYMPMRKAQRRALPAGLAVADGVLGRRADLGGTGGDPVLDARGRRGPGYRVVHERHHSRRVPARHVRPGVRQRSAFAGIVAGTVVMLAVKFFGLTSWQWYVLVGALVTYAAGVIASRLAGEAPVANP